MKTNIYIHIGLHKTGSTSIQATFFKNRDILLKHDINYLGISQNHSTTIYPLVRKEITRRDWKRLAGVDSEEEAQQYNAGVDRALRRELESNTCRCFVISGEGLSRLTDDEIEHLKEKLAPFAHKFRIVVYVRDPYSYINSAFQQEMQTGLTFEQIIADPPLPLYRRIDSFIRVFGRDNVDIRIFESTRFVNGDLIADFLAGIEASPELAKDLEIVRANVALSHEAALLLNEINKHHLKEKGHHNNPERADQLRKWLEAISGQRFRCPRAALAVAEPEFAADLRWLHRVIGERVFRTRPEPDDLTPDWSRESLAALAILINDMARVCAVSQLRAVRG